MASRWQFQWLRRLIGLGNCGHSAPDSAGAVVIDKTTDRHYPLSKRVTRIGRGQANEIALPDEPSVSRFHARITFHDGNFQVEDLGSTNGTFLNGRIIKRPTKILPFDHLSFGNKELIFEFL